MSGSVTRSDVLIIGAGLTGLSLGQELRKRGLSCIILEKDNAIGGLLKTVKFAGRQWELGPKFFFFDPNRIDLTEWLEEFCDPSPLSDIKAVAFRNGTVDSAVGWPLNREELGCLYGDTAVKHNSPSNPSPQSDSLTFPAMIKSLVDIRVYKDFFENYSRRFWGIDPEQLSGSWAPKKIRITDSWEQFFDARETVLIPRGGYNSFIANLARNLSIVKGTVVQADASGVRLQNGERYSADRMVFTCRPDSLFGGDLPVRSMIVVLIQLEGGEEFWRNNNVGFGYISKGSPFTRMTWLSGIWESVGANVPPGVFSLELPCDRNKLQWSESALKNEISGFVSSFSRGSSVSKLLVSKLPNAYPIPTLDYESQLRDCHSRIPGFEEVWFGIGRFGRFKFLWMRDSVADAIDLANQIAGNQSE